MYNFLRDFLRRSPRPPGSELELELRRQIRSLESDRAAAVKSNLLLAERVGERTAERDAATRRNEELEKSIRGLISKYEGRNT